MAYSVGVIVHFHQAPLEAGQSCHLISLLCLCLQNRPRTKEGQEGARFKELNVQLEQLRQQLGDTQQRLTSDEQSLQQVKFNTFLSFLTR